MSEFDAKTFIAFKNIYQECWGHVCDT